MSCKVGCLGNIAYGCWLSKWGDLRLREWFRLLVSFLGFLLSSPICFGLGILGLLLVVGLLYLGQVSDTFQSPRRF